jgi:hypothetical protein
MKRLINFFALSLLILGSANQVFADLAPPPKPKPSPALHITSIKLPVYSSLEIMPDSKAYDARLLISKESLRQLQAALEATPADQSITQRIGGTSSHTIMSGVFLFLSLSFGGVWLARAGHSRGQKVMAAMMIGAAVIGAAAIITRANGAPPAYRWRNLGQNLTEGRTTEGRVTIEIMLEGNGIKLILPQIPANTKAGEE